VAGETAAGEAPPEDAVAALADRGLSRAWLGHASEGAGDARQALALARRSGYRPTETRALTMLAVIAFYSGDLPGAAAWVRQARESLTSAVPGPTGRLCLLTAAVVLAEAGDPDSARRACADGLAQCRAADDRIGASRLLMARAHLEGLAGNVAEMGRYLNEAVEASWKAGDDVNLSNCVMQGGYLCAATAQWRHAATLWAAQAANARRVGSPVSYSPAEYSRRQDWMRRIEAVLQPAAVRAAVDRGSRMTLAAAAEFVTLLTAPGEAEPPGASDELTERERELVTLVAQGRTNAEIAARLFISVRTVTSHLDRIRAKTGHRRRADLTRLALREGLV
jgi:non-specific serine/threonine protein kinase